jgi:hypothetical protein
MCGSGVFCITFRLVNHELYQKNQPNMKFKQLIVCMLCMIASIPTAFSEQPEKSFDEVIRSFAAAHINANSKELQSALHDEATFRIPRQQKMMVQRKSDVIKGMDQEVGVKQNCSFSYEVIEKTGAMVLARVDFKYPEFVQRNYMVIERAADLKWKIMNVYKVSVDQPGTRPTGNGEVNTFN